MFYNHKKIEELRLLLFIVFVTGVKGSDVAIKQKMLFQQTFVRRWEEAFYN